MQSDSLIALKIGSGTDSPADALKQVLDRALGLMGKVVLAVEDEQERLEMTVRLESFRRDCASGRGDLANVTFQCFDLCEQLVSQLHDQQGERRNELRRLVTLVRDTVALLVGDGDALSSQVEQAARRFSSLLQISDFRQLKQRLMAEVGDLQRLAGERQRQWRRTVEMFETRIVALEEQLVVVKQEAAVDPLTGIANRRVFEQALREALESPNRQLIVAVFDLDSFKQVNDIGGHQAGDQVLQSVSRTLTGSVRKADLVARIGGDEFALLGLGATLREAEPRVRAVVNALSTLPTGIEQPKQLSASCGMAEYCAGDTIETLMRRADQALYEAKHAGKNRLVVKSPPFIRDLMRGKH